MLASVFTKTLADRARLVLVAAGGGALLALLNVWLYPTIAEDISGLADTMPQALTTFLGGSDYGTVAGYLNTQLYSLTAPLVVLGIAIAAGTAAIAGEERDGTLGLVLTYPLSRSRFTWEKWAALTVQVLAAVTLVVVGVLAGAAAGGVAVPWGGLLAVSVHLGLLGLAFGSLALAVGAATGNRTLSLGVAAGFALLSYVANGLFALVEGLEGLREVSPWYHYQGVEPLTDGLAWGSLALLAALVAVFLAAALAGFRTRDLRT
jgi:ABC-2 type transport system permease protein